MERHLTLDELEQWNENKLDAAQRDEIEHHLAACAVCRARSRQYQRMDRALHALPHQQPPPDLIARIAIRIEQEQVRRARLPFIVLATLVSFLVALWFCIELGIALQENGALDFWTLLTSYSDQFSADSVNILLALIESIPLTETLLTACALLTVGVFAQQLVDLLRPRALGFK